MGSRIRTKPAVVQTSATLWKSRRRSDSAAFMNHETRYRLLRIILFFSAFAWSISVIGVFATWESASGLLQGLGAKPVAYDPMLDYWLRMASGAFALVGIGFFLAAFRPRKYAVILPWLGWLMVIEGVILLVHG